MTINQPHKNIDIKKIEKGKSNRKSNLNNPLDITKIKTKCLSVSSILKTLSHPERLLLLCQLTNQKQTVSSLVKKSNLSQSQTSQYLKRLEHEKFVNVEKLGKFRFYSIQDKNLTKLIKAIQKIYC